MDLVRPRVKQEFTQLADLDFVARASASGVDEDDIDRAKLAECAGHFDWLANYSHREVDDLGICLELFHCGDPKSVNRE